MSTLNMHLSIEGYARLSVVLGDDGSVRLFWRTREGLIFEPEIQEVIFKNGQWLAGDSRGPLVAEKTENIPFGAMQVKA